MIELTQKDGKRIYINISHIRCIYETEGKNCIVIFSDNDNVIPKESYHVVTNMISYEIDKVHYNPALLT